jgi:hypothetical protein
VSLRAVTSGFRWILRPRDPFARPRGADCRRCFQLRCHAQTCLPLWLQAAACVTWQRAYFQRESTLTKPEIEIATNIVNARWRSPYANYEHEVTGERDGHLDPRRVEALITGLPTSFDDPRQQVVYELASALVALRIVPLGLPLGDLSSAARAAVLSQLQFRPGNSPSFSHTSNHRCPLATLCRRPGKESDSSQDPSSGLTSVRPGVRKQRPGDRRCEEPH